jgi:hypothetical protein
MSAPFQEAQMTRRPNIFRSSAASYGPEDRFTANLEYLFFRLPDIGRQWFHHLLDRAGREVETFVAATKHGEGTKHDQPDFLMQGGNIDLLCEHKLGAPLGSMQLERYLAHAGNRGRNTALAFVAAGACPVPENVRVHPLYLCPKGGAQPHFSWDELYPIVASSEEVLALEFREYMEGLGLRPCETEHWRDLFFNAARYRDFAAQWKETIAYFESMGATTVLREARSPGLEVRDARPWLRQFYLKPVSAPTTPFSVPMAGPFVRASVGLYNTRQEISAFEGPGEMLANMPFPVFSAPARSSAGERVILCREYFAPLDAISSPNSEVMRERLLEFARATFDHAVALGERGTSQSVQA